MLILQAVDGVTRVAGVRAAMVSDYEGIPIEVRAAVGLVKQEHLCAWAAEIGRFAARTAEVWEGGPLATALFESSMGSLMLADVGKGYLVVVSDPTVNAGLLRLEVDRAAEVLRGLLSTPIMPGSAAEQAAAI
jgi:predicted regulator of Ras-like GTPase activity (Roadblock/LC7/MglB family)